MLSEREREDADAVQALETDEASDVAVAQENMGGPQKPDGKGSDMFACLGTAAARKSHRTRRA